MRATVFVLGVAALAGCDGLTGPSEPASAYVWVTNHRGTPVRPDGVIWYYPPDSPLYDGDHAAECINDGCSLWAVPVEASGDVFISAFRSRPYPGDPYCVYSGYDAKPATLSADDPPTVNLRLDMALGCQ
jgi:hypothetical protein